MRALPLTIFLLPFLTACGESETHAAPHWSYQGETGPEHWGDLSPDWILAETGRRQSPIDIAGAVEADVPDLQVSYRETPLEIVNNGHAITVEYAPGSAATIGGERYELLQFHFHSPSEHTIDGQHAAMEAHLVHRNAAGQLAVIGVMIRPGAENALLDAATPHLPAQAGPAVTVDGVRLNIADFLPADMTSYRYSGSLTTPPCSEDVRWIVLSTPVEASQAQIDAFRAVISGNDRPVQPLHGREITAGK